MTTKRLNILFAAYRDWSKNVYNDAWPQLPQHHCSIVQTPDELNNVLTDGWDVIILVGWSWIIPLNVLQSSVVVGMHPSDLPAYAGGSPIQNQILNGVETSHATLFRLNEQLDAGAIIDKEEIDLRGHLNCVFTSISTATVKMILRFIERFPNNEYLLQSGTHSIHRRLKPEHSRFEFNIKVNDGHPMTCKEMWNFIRCREDPYPNAYFDDETGRLIIKHVEFEPKQ